MKTTKTTTTKTTNDTNKREAISYGRFSSDAQEEGDSVRRQREAFEAVCARYSDRMTPSSRYTFGEFFGRGESGLYAVHLEEGGSLRRFLDLLRDGTIVPNKTVLVLEMWSRFGRMEPDLAIKLLSDIVRSGCAVAVYSPDMWVETADLSSQQFIIIAMCLQMAHAESSEKRRIGRANRQRIRETGRTKDKRRLAACPFWLTVGADGEYHENDYAPLVKEMFRLSALGHGAGEVSNMLGNPTRPVTRNKVKVDATIDVLGVLRNRAVIGEYRPAIRVGKWKRDETKEVKEGYYPVVVPVEVFNAVQAGLDSRRTQRGRKGAAVSNLFTELFIGADGLPMHLKIESSGRHVLRRKTKGPNRTWDYKQVEYTLLRFLRELRLTGTATSPVEAYELEKAQLDKRLEEVAALQEEYPSAANARTMQNLEGRIAALADKIELEQQRIPETTSLDATHGVLAALDNATGDELLRLRTRLKMLIRRLVSRIDVLYEVRGRMRSCTLTVRLTNGESRVIHLANAVLTRAGHRGEFNSVHGPEGTTEVIRFKVG